MSWERARQPEQKAERREAILQAAAVCFDEGGLASTTLAAIAEGAQLSKGNLYRYFVSRDGILLELLLRELAGWADHVEAEMDARAGSDDVVEVAGVLRRSFEDRPRLCALSAISLTVLERQLTVEAVLPFKQRVVEGLDRATAAVQVAMPSLSEMQAYRFVRFVNLALGQLWSSAHPAPALQEVYAQPEYTGRLVAFGPALEDVMTVLLRGLLAEEDAD